MKVKPSSLFECLHLDPNYMSLTAQNLMVLSESFHLLDIHNDELLNDCQVKIWMKCHTDLNKAKRNEIFELIDLAASGFFDLDNFYFFTSIMLAVKDGQEKEFINQHARSLYNLFEVRTKGKMSFDQFAMVGWLFGFDQKAVDFFKQEFDIGEYKKIYLKEFKLFLIICMEMEEIMDRIERVRAFKEYRNRLIWNLEDQLVGYVKYNKVPPPADLINTIRWIQKPYIRRGKGVHRPHLVLRIRKRLIRHFLMRIGKLTQGRLKCGRGMTKRLIKLIKFILRIETPKDKQLKKEKTKKLKKKKKERRKKKEQQEKRFLCFKRKRQTHPWGDDQRMYKKKVQHDEVSKASGMPSWINFLDEEENKRKQKPKFAILDAILDDEDERRRNEQQKKKQILERKEREKQAAVQRRNLEKEKKAKAKLDAEGKKKADGKQAKHNNAEGLKKQNKQKVQDNKKTSGKDQAKQQQAKVKKSK